MSDAGKSLVDALREQPFYRGQILSLQHVRGKPADSAPYGDLFRTGELAHMKGSSMPALLQTLGMEDVYAGLRGGWRIAFPPQGRFSDDVILKAPKGLFRETFWHVIALTEALDFGRCSLVVCRNDQHAKRVHAQLADVIRRADVSYALTAAQLLCAVDYDVFKDTFPQILVTTPAELLSLLMRPSTDRKRAGVLRALSRIIIPSAEEWPPALASNAAFVMRKLNLECLLVGAPASAVVTIDPCPNAELFVQELVGRSIRQENVVAGDGVETVPTVVAYCSGSMVRDPNNPGQWIREPLVQFAAGRSGAYFATDVPVTTVDQNRADSLLAFLAGGQKRSLNAGCELHYVLDVSGSMADVLPRVVESVIGDLRRKIEKGTFGASAAGQDRLRLSVFDESTIEVFASDFSQGTMDEFEKVARAQTIRGGTDIPQALAKALEASVGSGKEVIELILFSDGCSLIPAPTKNALVRMLRENRARGVAIGIVYVALDFDPPHDITNLVERELGGVVVKVSQAELSAASYGSGVLDESQGSCVVVLSGERGLPAFVIQPYQGRERKLVFARDLSVLVEDPNQGDSAIINPRQVHSVVVSGRFPNAEEIVAQVSRMGRRRIPIFVLLEAEASSRLTTESLEVFRAHAGLWRMPLVNSENAHSRNRMLQALVEDEMDVFHFRYLAMGDVAYPQLRKYIEGTLKPEDKNEVWRSVQAALPEGYRLIARNDRLMLRREQAVKRDVAPDMRTFSQDAIALSGQGETTVRDRAWSELIYHEGARLDIKDKMLQSAGVRDGQIQLTAITRDVAYPIVSMGRIAFSDSIEHPVEQSMVERLGRLARGPVRVSLDVIGLRQFPLGNLDAVPRDDYHMDASGRLAPRQIECETRGLMLKLDGASSPDVLAGIAGSLKVALVALFRYADQTVFVHQQNGEIWLFDLAPGGNGAVDLLYSDRALLSKMLQIGGRLLLDCPCEGGLKGASTQADVSGSLSDNGCPRCVRTAGVVVKDTPAAGKRETLEWLQDHGYLPGTAQLHLSEKYEGIDTASRISGEDSGSRKGCMKLIRKILLDRLGLEIADREVAGFEWKPDDGEILGIYDAGANKIRMVRGLREWFALDVLAHELFHNYQCKCDELFNHAVLGDSGSAQPPFGGKLFIEGSAMWAESHVMDTLAIQSSLTAANLRQGDEYGAGFQLFKYLEENHGLAAVLSFLHSGDITQATAGKIPSIEKFYSLAGVAADTQATRNSDGH